MKVKYKHPRSCAGIGNSFSRLLLFSFLLISLISHSGCIVPARPRAASFNIPIESRLILQVPFYPDVNGVCGPGALAAVMTYSGHKVSAEQAMLNLAYSKGGPALGRDMVYWARKEGLKAEFYRGSPDDMVQKVIENKPLIIRLDKAVDALPPGSYAVVLGYNPEGVVINSCILHQQIVPWSVFLSSWYKAGYFTALIEPM